MSDVLPLLGAIQAYEKLASAIPWSISNTMGTLIGYLESPIAQRWRTKRFANDDSEWLEWRLAAFLRSHDWENHLRLLSERLREVEATIVGNLLQASGVKPTEITEAVYPSYLKFGVEILGLAESTHSNGLCPQPTWNLWVSNKQDRNLLKSHIAKYCPPENMLSLSDPQRTLFRNVQDFSKQVLGVDDPMDACHCPPVAIGSPLEKWCRLLKLGIESEFAEAKKLLFKSTNLIDHEQPVAPVYPMTEDGLCSSSRVLTWGGVRYSLTRNQLAVVKVLHDAYSKGKPDVGLAEFKHKCDIAALDESFSKVFQLKRKGKKSYNPVLEVIESSSQGTYRLNDKKKS